MKRLGLQHTAFHSRGAGEWGGGGGGGGGGVMPPMWASKVGKRTESTGKYLGQAATLQLPYIQLGQDAELGMWRE